MLCKKILDSRRFTFNIKLQINFFRNIPYCSSDLWIGYKQQTATGMSCKENCNADFHFMGRHILDSVFTDLLYEYGMKDSSLVVVAGVR